MNAELKLAGMRDRAEKRADAAEAVIERVRDALDKDALRYTEPFDRHAAYVRREVILGLLPGGRK